MATGFGWRRAGAAAGKLLGGAALASLGACASFSGQPRPVMPLGTMMDLATGADYGIPAALAVSRGAMADDEKQRYRDAFIAVQVAAMDAQYFDFRKRLATQAKSTNFGLDLGILGLTGAGAVAASQGAANILSAGGAGLTGAKASFNKEVYFEKALPAIIASMDAERLTAKTRLLNRMQLPIRQYSIPEAIADLSSYQEAATLDGGIERITASASADKGAAERTYANLTKTCAAPEDAAFPVLGRIAGQLRALQNPADAAVMAAASTEMGTATTLAFADQLSANITKLGQNYCTKAAADTLAATLSQKTGGKIQ